MPGIEGVRCTKSENQQAADSALMRPRGSGTDMPAHPTQGRSRSKSPEWGPVGDEFPVRSRTEWLGLCQLFHNVNL